MGAPQRWLRGGVAILIAAFTLGSAPAAGAQEFADPGLAGAGQNSGFDNHSVHYDAATAGQLIDTGSSLIDVNAGTGAYLGTDTTAFVSDQMAQLNDLAMADQLSLEALRAAEQARINAQRNRRGKLPASVPYAAEFEASGAAHGVDPALLAAVAQTESGFNPDVVECRRDSSAGARGLMQFMPGTAAGYGIDPCDPAQAIDAGARMLAGLHEQFGDWDLALAAYNWGPANVKRNGRNGWPPETRNYVNKVNAAWQSYAAAAQSEVGPEGCPTFAPAGTLRAGSESVGIYELCRRSVEAAPTPAAANAIVTALSGEFLGKPYSQPRRNEVGWYDCSSFVTRAYTVGGTKIVNGWPPTTASMTSGVGWGQRISFSEARPGDLLLEPAPGHVGMLLADGYWVHTNRTGDVSHVKRAPTSPDLVLRVTA